VLGSVGPPGPKGHPIYGGLSRYHDDPIAFLEDNAATYGDVSAFRFFHLPVWQLHHPDDVRSVLVDSEGAFTKGVTMEGFRPLIGKGLLLALFTVRPRGGLPMVVQAR
jgi:cytochrome P450